MSHGPIRKIRNIAWCRHVAELKKLRLIAGRKIQTPENIPSFYFIHFFEDLTQYENAFWRQLKPTFKPSIEDKEYLSRRRKIEISG